MLLETWNKNKTTNPTASLISVAAFVPENILAHILCMEYVDKIFYDSTWTF